MHENNYLRARIRNQRQRLTKAEQLSASQGLREQLIRSPLYQKSQRITFYMANDGEIDPQPVMEHAWSLDKTCLLPVVDRKGENRLRFTAIEENTPMVINRYGIAEPEHQESATLPASDLELVLVPLVAIDKKGNRLGMGKGYYDRTFAFMLEENAGEKPLLLGLAHDFQLVDRITHNSWDVPLHGIVTASQLLLFSH